MASKRWLRELSSKTGESGKSLSRRGFTLIKTKEPASGDQPATSMEHYIDWDHLDSLRGVAIRPAGKS